MSDGSAISWTDATWNIVTGCSVLSAGCTNCYAMREAGVGRTRGHPSRVGLTTPTKAGPVWNGQVRFNDYWLDQPLKWSKPRLIFVCAHSDLFHDMVETRWVDLIMAVIVRSPMHVFQILTKRTAGMRAYFQSLTYRGKEVAEAIEAQWPDQFDAASAAALAREICRGVPRNVMLGASVEDQRAADERLWDLLSVPASFHWVSYEPALGPVDWRRVASGLEPHRQMGFTFDPLTGNVSRSDGSHVAQGPGHLDLIVAGGESGPSARVCHPEWFRRTRDDCADAGVRFHFKQWGNWRHIALPDGSALDLGTLKKGQVPKIKVPAGVEPIVLKKNGTYAVVGIDGVALGGVGGIKSPVALMERVGRKSEAGHLLDGFAHRDPLKEMVL